LRRLGVTDRKLGPINSGGAKRAIMHGWGNIIMVTTTRRAAIRGATSAIVVATPALALPTLSAEPDNMFGLIAEHRRLYAACGLIERKDDEPVWTALRACEDAIFCGLSTSSLAGIVAALWYHRELNAVGYPLLGDDQPESKDELSFAIETGLARIAGLPAPVPTPA
jgi:hypothetical protein